MTNKLLLAVICLLVGYIIHSKIADQVEQGRTLRTIQRCNFVIEEQNKLLRHMIGWSVK